MFKMINTATSFGRNKPCFYFSVVITLFSSPQEVAGSGHSDLLPWRKHDTTLADVSIDVGAGSCDKCFLHCCFANLSWAHFESFFWPLSSLSFRS